MSISNIAVAIIVVSILLAVGLTVTSQVYENLPTPSDTEAQTVLQNVKTQTYNAYKLMPVLIIVLVAGGIIAYLTIWRG